MPPEEVGDWIWRCRLPEGYSVLTGGTVVAVILPVGVPEIVDGAALEVRQHASGIHRLAPAFVMGEVPSQPAGRDGVQPVQRAGGTHAGFIEARHLGGRHLRANERINRFQPLRASGREVGQRSFAERVAGEEVAHDLGQPLAGQQLVLLKIDGHAPDSKALLHGRRDLRRKRGAVDAAAGTGFDFGRVLGDLPFRLGQIEDLAALDAVRRLFGQ